MLITHDRKFSSASVLKFLKDVVEELPESSEIAETFQLCVDEIEGLAADAEIALKAADTPQKGGSKYALTSGFEIESRPGMRSTKISQKLRQEKDRANMTTEDEEYTKIVVAINDVLKELFLYNLYTFSTHKAEIWRH